MCEFDEMTVMKGNGKLILRSEEHTSELQSHSDLVCRLLLEKKLEGILERMDGVGEVSVMITLSDDGTRTVSYTHLPVALYGLRHLFGRQRRKEFLK